MNDPFADPAKARIGAVLRPAGLLWCAFSALFIWLSLASIGTFSFPDVDDALRLVEVRDLLGGQSWFDLQQHRVAPAMGGVLMHWSRLVDIPLALAILLLRPLVGMHMAEQAAVVAVPLLTFACALGLVAILARRMVPGARAAQVSAMACAVMIIAVPLVIQMRPMRIDHHGWQVVAALAALAGLVARDAVRGARLAGFAMAACLTISFEGVPLALAFAATLGLRSFWHADTIRRLAAYLQTLAVGAAALFAATRGLADMAVHCDQISPLHIAALGLAALGVTVMSRQAALSVRYIVAGFAVIGALALAMVAAAAPQCAGGTFDAVDPVVRRFWYDNVTEGLPLWRQSFGLVLEVAVPTALGLFVAVRRAVAENVAGGPDRPWTEYALMLTAAGLVALLVFRAGAVAIAFAAVPVGCRLAEWGRADTVAGNARRPLARLAGLAAIAGVLLPTLPLTLALTVGRSLHLIAPDEHEGRSAGRTNCRLADGLRAMENLPPTRILAPLDIGPLVLLHSRHAVLATGHHRGAPAMRMVIDAFTGSDDRARMVVHASGSAYVILCPDLAEPYTYANAAPDGFSAHLMRGQPPQWLAPVTMPQGVGLKVWRVLR